MKSSPIRKFLITSVALAGLVACASTSDPDVTVIPEEPPEEPSSVDVTMGTASGAGNGSNGLRFADGSDIEFDGEIIPAGAERLVHTLRGVVVSRTELEEGTDIAAKMADMEFTIIPDAGDPENFIITADVDGETALINFRENGFYCDGGPVTSSAGNQYCFAIQPLSDDLALVYAFTEGFFNDGPMVFGPGFFDSEVVMAAWIGLETNPDLLAFKGLTEYYGEFGLVIGVDNEDIMITDGGDIGMLADFSAGTIQGGMGGENGWAEFDGEIAGNGFSANITDFYSDDLDDASLEIVGDIGQIDGVFYGVTGSTAAGTILVNTQVTDGENTYDAAGAGLFVMEEESFFDER